MNSQVEYISSFTVFQHLPHSHHAQTSIVYISKISEYTISNAKEDCTNKSQSLNGIKSRPGEGDEKLKQIQFGMLREGDDDPERRLEIVDIDVERRVGQSTEFVVVFQKSGMKCMLIQGLFTYRMARF